MLEKIVAAGESLALIIRTGYRRDGIHFFTGENSPQQLGYMLRPKGYTIAPHVHIPVKRHIDQTAEVLFIKSGRVRIDLYTSDKVYYQSVIVNAGDVVLLEDGGHGFFMLEESEIIEVKQGPYAKDDDKVRMAPLPDGRVVYDPSMSN